MIWEAKGDPPPEKVEKAGERRIRSQHIQTPVCALANQVGGTLIVGATRDKTSKQWSLPGVVPPNDEMKSWVERAVNQVRPTPRHRVHTIDLESGNVVVLVEVERETNTPCMTASGEVYERVSSESVKVTDPTRLAALMERGRAAIKSAELLAQRSAEALEGEREAMARCTIWVTLVIAATEYQPDISSRLFATDMRDQLARISADRLWSHTIDRALSGGYDNRQEWCDWRSIGYHRSCRIVARWDGSVAVREGFDSDALRDHDEFSPKSIGRAWGTALETVELLGGAGLARVHITVEAREESDQDGWWEEGNGTRYPEPVSLIPAWKRLPPLTTIRREAEMREPTEDELKSVFREIRRSAGFSDPEPTTLGAEVTDA